MLRKVARQSLAKDVRALVPVKANDSSGALTIAALLGALWAWYHRQPETVGPQDYDLNTYRPKRREW